VSQHTTTLIWQRDNAKFTDKRYSRAHTWLFDGGASIPASSSPDVVPVPYSVPENVDPEEAFIVSLSSCHMLWFLDFAARAGYTVDSYRDEAVGLMEKNADGKMWIARVTLHPHVVFSGEKGIEGSRVSELHHQAHESCFIANSVKTEIEIEGTWETA
jgi:organic hydroperoxide reductase OsmC/OhrA